MKKLITVFIFIVLLSASSSADIYRHPSGLFSLEHPPGWSVVKEGAKDVRLVKGSLTVEVAMRTRGIVERWLSEQLEKAQEQGRGVEDKPHSLASGHRVRLVHIEKSGADMIVATSPEGDQTLALYAMIPRSEMGDTPEVVDILRSVELTGRQDHQDTQNSDTELDF